MSGIKTESLDHYGLVMGMIRELGIMEVIEEELPTRSASKIVTHAMGVAAMIINGLGYANKQLYLTPRFFEKKALGQLFQSDCIEARHFNKEALGRTLDRLFEYGVSELYEKIARKALERLDLTPSTIHLDSTSFHLDGAYANQQEPSSKVDSREEEGPKVVHITQGYSRDHHPELNQVVLNLIVEHQAGIPVWMKPGDGNQIDTQVFRAIVEDHIDALRQAYDTPVKVIADAALFTREGIEKIREKEALFISRVPTRLKQAKAILQDHDPEALTRLDDDYRYIPYAIEYAGMTQRWVLYQSAHAQSREDRTIEKAYRQKEKEEAKSLAKLQKRPFFCEADAHRALEEITAQLHCLDVTEKKLIACPKYRAKGRPKADAVPDHYEYYWQLQTRSDAEKLKEEQAQKSGLFILATNDMNLSPQELLDAYKSQQRVERGFRFLKSPQFLSDAIFLKNPKRIEAMLMIMTLSLLVYSALEYTGI